MIMDGDIEDDFFLLIKVLAPRWVYHREKNLHPFFTSVSGDSEEEIYQNSVEYNGRRWVCVVENDPRSFIMIFTTNGSFIVATNGLPIESQDDPIFRYGLGDYVVVAGYTK